MFNEKTNCNFINFSLVKICPLSSARQTPLLGHWMGYYYIYVFGWVKKLKDGDFFDDF